MHKHTHTHSYLAIILTNSFFCLYQSTEMKKIWMEQKQSCSRGKSEKSRLAKNVTLMDSTFYLSVASANATSANDVSTNVDTAILLS